MVLAIGLAGLPLPALAAESDATLVRRLAEEAYVDGRYSEASNFYRVAFQYDHDPWLLYARAAAEQRAGNFENAIGLYSWYIATDPPEDKRKAAEASLGVCKLEQSGRTEHHVMPPPGSSALPEGYEAPSTTNERSDGRDRRDRPVWQDPLGLSLGVAGLSGVIIGGGLLGGARRAVSSDEFEASYQGYTEGVDKARRLRIGASVTFGIAAAALVGSAIAYTLAGKRKRQRERLSLSPTGLRLRF